MTLVAGCYERFLFGFSRPDTPSKDAPELVRTFTHAAHKGVVKSLAAAGPWVVSGGADDLIHLYDMKNDKDLGFLMNPGEGAVSSLVLFTPSGGYNPTHLLAGCTDGTISVWRAGGGWECMRTLRGHRGEISSIAVHPSGCLALTTARDGTLKLWDLVKGRVTFSTKVETEADNVEFSPSGTRYALQAGSLVVVKPVSNAGGGGEDGNDGEEGEEVVGSVVKLQHTRRVMCLRFGSGGDGIVMTGAEDGALRVWDAATGKELLYIPRAHSTRIKAMTVPYAAETAENKPPKGKNAALLAQVPVLLATASSDGAIKLWSLRAAVASALKRGVATAEDGGEGVCLCETNTKARLTTLCAVDPVDVIAQRQQAHTAVKQALAKKKKKEAQTEKEKTGVVGAKKRKVEEVPKKKQGGKGIAISNGGGVAFAGEGGPPRGIVKKKKVVVAKEEGIVRRDGTVSFLDEEDARREGKKQRKVQLSAKRAAEQRAGKQRRARVPGTRGDKDA